MMANPFTPGFGTTPPVVVGRGQLLGEIAAAFGDAHDPHRATWLQAPQGAGKTVLLNRIQDLARQSGWLIVQEDAQTPGDLTARLTRRVSAVARQRPPNRARRRQLDDVHGSPDEQAAALRDTIFAVLEQHDHLGVLMTVDEIHTASRDTVAPFDTAVQQLISEGCPVVAVVAGLPGGEGDDLAPILRRYAIPSVEELTAASARVGLQQSTVHGSGRFDGDALELAVAATGGYPYMLQLVGFWSWHQADDGHITIDHVRAALPRCEHELVGGVAGLSSLHLSGGAQRYLEAMACDDGPSRTSDIIGRLGGNAKAVGVVRHRLIGKGIIEPAGHGHVAFRLPGHRALLRARQLLER